MRKTFPEFSGVLNDLISSGECSSESRICYVDDGSTDDTWDIICQFAQSDSHVVGIRLSRNRGHQNALLAGLMEARGKCDLVITMDCDGQDDPHAAKQMVQAFADGYDVAYGVRSARDADPAFKRISAGAFYKLLSVMGSEAIPNHGDYRMLSARALEGLSGFEEVNLYLRGMVPLLGFPSTTVEYERMNRVAGQSRFSLRKMLALAVDGITSQSVKPIRFISGLGIIFSLLGLIGVCWAVISFVTDHAIAGWASTICMISLIGGLQLLCLGVIGEYVGKIYLESKHRPRYIISERIYGDENKREHI